MQYQLRELPRQDYPRQEREATQGETNMSTGLHQLAALMAQIVKRQEDYCREQKRPEEDRQQREEELQQRDEE